VLAISKYRDARNSKDSSSSSRDIISSSSDIITPSTAAIPGKAANIAITLLASLRMQKEQEIHNSYVNNIEAKA